MELKDFITTTIRELNEQKTLNKLNIKNEYIDDLKKELSKFNSSEELLRKGGISIETLDRLAHGFSVEDIKTLNPNQLKVRWKDDLENVKYEINKSGLTPKQWASKINISEPIDVSYWEDETHKRGLYIEDGDNKNIRNCIQINFYCFINISLLFLLRKYLSFVPLDCSNWFLYLNKEIIPYNCFQLIFPSLTTFSPSR